MLLLVFIPNSFLWKLEFNEVDAVSPYNFSAHRCTTWPVCVSEIFVPSWTSRQSWGGRSGRVLNILWSTVPNWWRTVTSTSSSCVQFTSWQRSVSDHANCVSFCLFQVNVYEVCFCFCQVTKEDKSFQNIMKSYRTQPQASSNVRTSESALLLCTDTHVENYQTEPF